MGLDSHRNSPISLCLDISEWIVYNRDMSIKTYLKVILDMGEIKEYNVNGG